MEAENDALIHAMKPFLLDSTNPFDEVMYEIPLSDGLDANGAVYLLSTGSYNTN